MIEIILKKKGRDTYARYVLYEYCTSINLKCVSDIVMVVDARYQNNKVKKLF